MRAEIPEGVLDLLSIPGLRPEKVIKIYKELGIATLDELEAAAKEDRIKEVKGLGAALQRKILQGLAIRRDSQGARHVHRAEELIANAADSLKRSGFAITRIVPAGDFRRGSELVVNLALVAQTASLEDGPTRLTAGEFTIFLTDAKRFGISLLLATGSEQHLRGLEEVAKARGLELTEDGLLKGGKIIASKTEEEIYKALGLQFIPPEVREGRGEIERARAKKLPKLVEAKDLHGILHAHTDASDGVATLQDMAEAVRKRGYQYFGVTDHSRTAHYAGGLNIEEIDARSKTSSSPSSVT
jgi:DNA polymerase (family 10)